MTSTAATALKNVDSKINTVNSNSDRIHKVKLEQHYSQVENWLIDKIAGAKNALQRRAWSLLSYYLRIFPLNPDIEISPEWAAKHFNVSRRTAYSWFKFLKKEGHVRVFKMRSDKGFIIGTEYFIYQHRFQWRTTTCKNLHKVDFIDKNLHIYEDGICIFTPDAQPQQPTMRTNLHVVETTADLDSSYNKNTPARAHDIRLKTILKTTTTTPPKSPPEPPPSPPPEEPLKSSVVVSLHEKIKPDHRVKVALSTLEKALSLYTEKQVETLISHINDPKKEIKNPAGYIHKACNEKWEIAEFDSSKIIDPEIQRKNQEENLQKQRDMTDESIKLKNIHVDGFFEGANQMRIAVGLPPKTKPTNKKNKQIQKYTNILEDKDKLDARKTLLKLQLEQYRKAENDNKKYN